MSRKPKFRVGKRIKFSVQGDGIVVQQDKYYITIATHGLEMTKSLKPSNVLKRWNANMSDPTRPAETSDALVTEEQRKWSAETVGSGTDYDGAPTQEEAVEILAQAVANYSARVEARARLDGRIKEVEYWMARANGYALFTPSERLGDLQREYVALVGPVSKESE